MGRGPKLSVVSGLFFGVWAELAPMCELQELGLRVHR